MAVDDALQDIPLVLGDESSMVGGEGLLIFGLKSVKFLLLKDKKVLEVFEHSLVD